MRLKIKVTKPQLRVARPVLHWAAEPKRSGTGWLVEFRSEYHARQFRDALYAIEARNEREYASQRAVLGKVAGLVGEIEECA